MGFPVNTADVAVREDAAYQSGPEVYEPSPQEHQSSTEQYQPEPEKTEDISVGLRRENDTGAERFRPAIPSSLEAAGIQPALVEQVILKNLYFRGEVSGRDLAKFLGMPFSLIEQTVENLKQKRLIECKRSSGLGSVSSYFSNTEAGRGRALECLDLNKHFGLAPAPLAQYPESVRQ